MTATIQATMANLCAEHGGHVPHLADIFINPTTYGQILLSSEQWDWQDLYDEKRKRFTIVEVEESMPESPLHLWISERELRRLALVPFALTADLMVAIGLLFAIDSIERGPISFRSPPRNNLFHTNSIVRKRAGNSISTQYRRPEFHDDVGRSVMFFHFMDPTREKTSWIQPLLDVPYPRRVSLNLLRVKSGEVRVFGALPRDELAPKTSSGQQTLVPSNPRKLDSFRLAVSGEGARFSRQANYLQINLFDRNSGVDGLGEESMTLRAFADAALEDMATGVSYRLQLFALWLASDGVS